MNLKFLAGGIAAALITLSSAANAVSVVNFDFSGLATGNEGSWSSRSATGTAGGSFDSGTPNTYTIGGIDLVASGSWAGGAADAYLDHKPGLGVCHGFSGTQCSPSNDDNVTTGEVLTLTFTSGVIPHLQIGGFKNAGHGAVTPSNSLLVALNGGALGATTFGAVTGAIFDNITSISFGFGGSNAEQFYLTGVSQVPIPPALLLFGTALGGMGLLARRRKKAA